MRPDTDSGISIQPKSGNLPSKTITEAYDAATYSPTTVRHVREFFRQFCLSLGHDIPIAKIRRIQAQTIADGE